METEARVRNPAAAGNDWDRRGLPGWTYHSKALAELEMRELFHTHWQIAGHVSDLAKPGDYFTLDLGGERALIVRDDKGIINAFHNLCRHRGSRLVAGESGHCRNALVCPFHGWVYNLDGTLRGAARPESYAGLDRKKFGLKPIEVEIWQGFIFIRFYPGPQPSVASLLAPFAEKISYYDIPDLVPTSGFWEQRLDVNWKSVRDVDNEGYHVAMAHPALQDLYGSTYFDESFRDGVSYSAGTYTAHAGRRWSVRNYVKLADRGSQPLSEDKRRLWSYFGLFPNAVIAVTPELVQFYQEFPVGVASSRLRGAIYRRAVEDRPARLARYLALRIDRETTKEDRQLSVWSNESMASRAFEGFYLSDLEKGVRSHHDHLRRVLPVVALADAPAESEMARVNAAMRP